MPRRKAQQNRSLRPSRLSTQTDGVQRLGTAALYLNAWSDTFLMPLTSLLLGVLLGWMLLVLCQWALGWHFEQIWPWWPLFAAYWLWQTEGWWFGLTYRRFARIQNGTFRLYGAFGRIRCQGRINEYRFRHFGNRPQYLSVEDPNGRIRRFSLHLCRNRYALVHDLFSANGQECLHQEGERMREELAQTRSARQYRLLHFYGLAVWIPLICISALQALTQPFFSLRPLDTAWYIGCTAAILLILPLALSYRRSFRHFRWLNLPAHHYWRQSRWGNRAAEALYAVRYLMLTAASMAAYSLFLTYNLAYLSLTGIPYETSHAHLHAENKASCYRGRFQSSTWKITVSMPAYRRQFDGDWCSMIEHDRAIAPTGKHMVYLRESTLAQELRFSPP